MSLFQGGVPKAPKVDEGSSPVVEEARCVDTQGRRGASKAIGVVVGAIIVIVVWGLLGAPMPW